MSVSTINGLEVCESVWMTKAGDPITVWRSWRERLFSWPWRPWVATRIVVPQVPDDRVYILGNRLIVGHPDTIATLKRTHDRTTRPSRRKIEGARLIVRD